MTGNIHLSIAEVADQTGISQAALRMWEKRYGWPKPERNESGYRTYSATLVADLLRLAALLDKGVAVGEIIRDGAPHWPSTLAAKPERPKYDFAVIPPPRSSEGRRIRTRLEDGLSKGDPGIAAWAKAQTPLLHPSDRGPAVNDLLALAGLG